MLELVKPKLEGIEIELGHLLRWENDGGKIIEVSSSTLEVYRPRI